MVTDYRVVTESGFEEFYSNISSLMDDYTTYPKSFKVYRANEETAKWVEIFNVER